MLICDALTPSRVSGTDQTVIANNGQALGLQQLLARRVIIRVGERTLLASKGIQIPGLVALKGAV